VQGPRFKHQSAKKKKEKDKKEFAMLGMAAYACHPRIPETEACSMPT
jgi:hypothetical protein